MNPFFEIILRTAVIYLVIIIGLRVFGKKELTQLSITDLVFILLISNAVQSAMIGNDTSVLGGIIAALSLFVVNYLLKNVFYKSKRISEFFQGDPLMLVYHGKPIVDHMAKAKITMDELEAVVREHGVKNIQDVDLAVFEVDGNISILSKNFSHETKHKHPRKTSTK
ncbi:MAG: DUF421 domain-containing protein [Candidatus Levybacteria bacterium]|nr:DUF421 domain-containing protein [Candidatus Levybacteria bacterium]MBP9815177.1 DUF421 domain-containing protein [Candidatus Levybacteria bacterium]